VYDVAMQQHDYQPDPGGTAKTIVTIFTRFPTWPNNPSAVRSILNTMIVISSNT